MEENKKPKLSKTEQDKKQIQKYLSRFNKAKMAVSNLHEKWHTLDMFDRGEQWFKANIPPWVPKPVTNLIRYVRTLKRANLASNIPKAHFYPEYEQDAPLVEKLQKAYNYVWDTKKVDRVVRRSIDRALLQGTAVVHVYYDENVVGGKYFGENNPENELFIGDIGVKRIPIANFFPDPDSYHINDCKFIEITEIVPLSVIKENPIFKEYVEENYGKDKLKNLSFGHVGQDDSEAGAIYDRDNNPLNSGHNVEGDEMVTLHTHYERYLKDGKWILDVSYYLQDTDFFLYRIEDVKPNVYPFAVLVDEEEENTIFGTSTAMDILENQKIINKLQQTAAILGVLHQNPQKIVLRESGINAHELAQTGTLAGKVWLSNIPNPIEVIKPQEIPSALFDLDDRVQNNIRDIVGVNEAYTGQSVGSLTTSTGVEALIERATIRDKDKMLQIDDFVEQISHLIVLHIIYKWKDRRPITNIQPDGKPDYDYYEPIDEITAENLTWRVRSDIYAQAPTTQATRRQQADHLLQMQGQFQFNPPVITPEEWIRFQDFDNKEEILKRMEADRQRMEQERPEQLAQEILQVSQFINELRSQGIPEEQIQQQARQMAIDIITQRQQGELFQNRLPDAPKQPQAPQGVTGELQMANMARGF